MFLPGYILLTKWHHSELYQASFYRPKFSLYCYLCVQDGTPQKKILISDNMHFAPKGDLSNPYRLQFCDVCGRSYCYNHKAGLTAIAYTTCKNCASVDPTAWADDAKRRAIYQRNHNDIKRARTVSSRDTSSQSKRSSGSQQDSSWQRSVERRNSR